MTDILEQLREESLRLARGSFDSADCGLAANIADAAIDEIERLRAFVGWVDSWVSNPVGAYSVNALDGLFGMTRDKMATLALSSKDAR